MSYQSQPKERRPVFVGPYHPIFSPTRVPGRDAYWMTPPVRPRCPVCKMRIRGKNHEAGSHHRAKVGAR